jgi:hypothetical protein
MTMMDTISKAPVTLEYWCDLVTHKGLYRASNFGRIKRLGRDDTLDIRCSYDFILLPRFNGSHRWVFLRDHQRGRRNYRVDRLVLSAFSGVPYYVHDVQYLDGDRRNCRLENLVRLNTRTRLGPPGDRCTVISPEELTALASWQKPVHRAALSTR